MNDKASRGLYRRPRSPYWWVGLMRDGKRVQVSTETSSRRKAEMVRERLILDLHQGTYITPADRRITFAQVWALIEADYRAKDQDMKMIRTCHNHLVKVFGRMSVRQISAGEIRRYRDARLDENAARSSIQNELSTLHRALVLAMHEGLITSVPYVERLKLDNARQGFFTSTQYAALYAELPDYQKNLADVGYLTGWRIQELVTRRWEHIDFERGVMRLEPGESKNRQAREFPMALPDRAADIGRALRAVLERQRAYVAEIEQRTGVTVPWVFCHKDGSPIRYHYCAWRQACARAGLEGRIFHDFRRTAVVNLLRVLPNWSVVKQLVGHKTDAMLWRYAVTINPDGGAADPTLARMLGKIERAASRKLVRLSAGKDKGAAA